MSASVNRIFENAIEVQLQIEEENWRQEQARREALCAERQARDARRAAPPPPIAIGTRIWRPVRTERPGGVPGLVADSPRVVEQTDKFGRPVKVLRASYGKRRVRVPIWYASDGKAGMVLFVYGPLPDDWTYLTVDWVAAGGKAARVSAVVGSREELFARYELE